VILHSTPRQKKSMLEKGHFVIRTLVHPFSATEVKKDIVLLLVLVFFNFSAKRD
jgi:hypothetical protein